MIPRTLHTFWDGPPLPPEYREFRQRWADLHPGWKIEVWDDQRYRDEIMTALVADYYSDPEYWSPLSNPWQWRTDIARYEILDQLGGVWIDADLEPLKPIDPILDQALGGAFAAREDRRNVNNAFLGSEPAHPFIRDVLAGLSHRIKSNRHLRVNRSIGAGYITEVAKRHKELSILPAHLVYPFSVRELGKRGRSFPQAYTKHHWHNQTTLARNR